MEIAARTALGRELTPKRQRLYDAFLAKQTKKLVFDREKQCLIRRPELAKHDYLRRVGVLLEIKMSLGPSMLAVVAGTGEIWPLSVRRFDVSGPMPPPQELPSAIFLAAIMADAGTLV